MATYIIIKIPGGKEIKYDWGQYEAFDKLVTAVNITLTNPDNEIQIHDGSPWDEVIEKLNQTKGFHVYGIIHVHFPPELDQNEYISFARKHLETLKVGAIELLAKTYTVQLLRLGTYIENVKSNGHMYDAEGNLKEGYKG